MDNSNTTVALGEEGKKSFGEWMAKWTAPAQAGHQFGFPHRRDATNLFVHSAMGMASGVDASDGFTATHKSTEHHAMGEKLPGAEKARNYYAGAGLQEANAGEANYVNRVYAPNDPAL